MRICEEFSRCASVYGEYNSIQAQVAQKLIDSTRNSAPRRILDLGCGSGTLFSRIDWKCDRFVGVDFSKSMLEHHPVNRAVELILGDFNDPVLFEKLGYEPFDHIYSASALQWADDLGSVFEALARLNTPISLAIFTSGTFKTLTERAGLSPLLRTSEEVIELSKRYLDGKYEIVRYALEFDSVREMFRYIKRSGVSAGRRVLNVSQTKQLMENYPLNYLEFEVLFITVL